MKRIMTLMCAVALAAAAAAQQTPLKRVYDESADRTAQIAAAQAQAADDGRFVICQVGGNWCKWCLRLAAKGNVLHIQDSSLLESGEGYDRDKLIRFLSNWTPAAVRPRER